MAASRRLWDSSVVIGYLAGYPRIADACKNINSRAERGELEVVVSALATIEVAYLQGVDDITAERLIQEFFGREYVVPVAIDVRIAHNARTLVRKYKHGPSLKPLDAAHVATAIQWSIPVLETTDDGLLRFDGLEGNPPVTIRRPLAEGNYRMPGV